jgi:putative hydrolase of the HAD superfamily
MLELLDVAADEAVMVGDTIEDDIEGARAVGMRALLVDREGRYGDGIEALDDLREVPAALGLAPN